MIFSQLQFLEIFLILVHLKSLAKEKIKENHHFTLLLQFLKLLHFKAPLRFVADVHHFLVWKKEISISARAGINFCNSKSFSTSSIMLIVCIYLTEALKITGSSECKSQILLLPKCSV
jgi:hypothetical protein